MTSELRPPAVCRAGCARTNITPAIGVSLAGYFHDRVAETIRDDLHANAMVIESYGERVALVSCDLISIDQSTGDAAKAIIHEETGIPADHVMVCATHTHTGPELRQSAVVPVNADWVAELPRLIADAVKGAVDSLGETTLRAGRAEVHGYSFNRLFRLKDSSELFGGGDRAIKEAGPIDPELQTLSIVDEDENLRGIAINFALHPDVIGGGSADFISADWPGEIARNIRAVYGDEVVTVFLQGTCGDINHNIHRQTHLPRGGPRKAVQLGRAIAGAAMYATEKAEPMTDIPVAAGVETLSIPYYTRDDEFMAELAALKAKPEPSAAEKYTIERSEAWPHDGEDAAVPVQTMRLGTVGLVALPAEIFVRIGLEIKEFSPSDQTFVVELANARSSTYVPTTDQAERGAYGAKPILSRWLCPDAGRRMADAAQVMLWEMWE